MLRIVLDDPLDAGAARRALASALSHAQVGPLRLRSNLAPVLPQPPRHLLDAPMERAQCDGLSRNCK
eukprot:9167137-Pyramimonas_sp.AAC.2